MRNLKYLQKLFFLLMMGFSLSFACVACDDDEDDEPFTEESDGGSTDNSDDSSSYEDEDTIDIVVTGEVKMFGVTYADINGYANLPQLPVNSGYPVIGVEINDGLYTQTTSTLDEERCFYVTFYGLSPDTEYKYRSFVRYADTTYYATEYRTFTTRQAYNITSTGEASDVTYNEATLTSQVQFSQEQFSPTEALKEHIQTGIAYSASASALHPDSVFDEASFKDSLSDKEYTVILTELDDNTTYYYASFTSFNGGIYVFSDVKSFTTDAHEWIDLGLPSGLKWATCNIGASSPEEYGDYFAWGETKTKSSYDHDNSTTYGLSFSELQSCGIIDADSNLTAAYDAATANWGSKWRMPTSDEIEELESNCTWKWIWETPNGVSGQLATGPNGNSIFLPAAGYRFGTGGVNSLDALGEYWSATFLYYFYVQEGLYAWIPYNPTGLVNGYRYYGRSVRPVKK